MSLAETITSAHPQLNERDLNYAVQATIDRIVFLRIAEARGLEEEGALDHVAQAHRGLYRRLLEIFHRADVRYNSGLFHFSKEAGRQAPDALTPRLTIDDDTLRQILGRLSQDSSPYDFAVLPPDILGQAYEQFLGYVLAFNPAGGVTIEPKPEVRKSKGVWYTPQFVVTHIVNETLGRLLQSATIQDAERLRIVDPACGSGSFLIAAYQYLLDWFTERYQRAGQRYRRHLTSVSGGPRRLTLTARKRILLRSIFGVDIDPQAVEVAKLSLLLKVIEGETQLAFAVDRLLPDLEQNIRCGNSLVGNDFFGSASMAMLTDDELASVNPFDWAEGFTDAQAGGGFDAVVGNPPWLMAGYYVDDAMPYFKRHYESAKGKTDLYYLFIEKACALVRDGGRIGMIVPSKLFQTGAASSLRQLLVSDNWVESIVDFGIARVFEGATNYSCILQLRKDSRGPVSVTTATCGFDVSRSYKMDRSRLLASRWHLHDDTRDKFWREVEAAGDPLETVASGFGNGVQSGADRVLIVTPGQQQRLRIESAHLRPILRGRNVRRFNARPDSCLVFPYKVSSTGFRLLSPGELPKYPKLRSYLAANEERLRSRKWYKRDAEQLSGQWYGMMYLADRSEFVNTHILTPALSGRSNFALGRGDLFVTGTAGVNSVLLRSDLQEEPEYFVALLNSSLLSQCILEHSPPYQGGYVKFSATYLREVPIRLYAIEWGVRVLIRGGLGRAGHVTPPAWRTTRRR